MSLIGNAPTYSAFTVKSIGGVNVSGSSTYEYCGVDDDALSVTVLAFFVVGYALPLTAISALYVLIACHVRRHRRRVVGPPRGTISRAVVVDRLSRGGPRTVSRAAALVWPPSETILRAAAGLDRHEGPSHGLWL